ncbi:hypothetical protein PN498_08660 [Oscillatoria sp. CS-180]|uniref:hypothetical protein n=1 Tax=Oscillatoria sp. CS-180 TaxID=3021720 RepID=UPI00232FA8E9|nr:hypothetical protein [Oscillatoria sp. CS-180]MDB9526055.1 hypothetical protein [Oscillatoria sp. CS-180]
MIHFSRFPKLLQWPAIPFAAIGFAAAAALPLMSAPAHAINDVNYEGCTDELIDAGIAADTAAVACALSLEPSQVSSCVTNVLSVASVVPEDALTACSRDRRPDEVATCVSSIHQTLAVDDSQEVLLHCHRSLLPQRYSACVVGVADAAGYATDEALARCIAAGYQPVDVAPTYIPVN